MKKAKLLFMIGILTVAMVVGCSKDGENAGAGTVSGDLEVIDLTGGAGSADANNGTQTPVEEEEEVREGMYRSELTNEWIDEELENQRPVAIMVDNELTALDHYGLNDADIVYELVNSTANGYVTRLMVVVKDWENIERLGSIRSARPTNFMVAAEYNAILIHDGGPVYINSFVAQPYTNNLSGGFARFSNGKATEFTEYVTSEAYTNPNTGSTYSGLIKRIEDAGYSTEYTSLYDGPHFDFSNSEYNLSDSYSNATSATSITLPFTHNGSNLQYNEDTKTYDYYEYNMAHIDPMDDNNILTFKNVIIENAEVAQIDQNGYMLYVIKDASGDGYYITNGECIPITWSKKGEDGITEYCDLNGNPIKLNTGKTYIAYSPTNHGELTIE